MNKYTAVFRSKLANTTDCFVLFRHVSIDYIFETCIPTNLSPRLLLEMCEARFQIN